MNTARLRRCARGVTLVELIISIVVIGVALAGIMLVIVRNVQTSADPMVWHQSVNIADAYLQEIMAQKFTNDGVVEASRGLYNDIWDYNGLDETPPHDQNGTSINVLTGYRVQVAVTAADLNGTGAANAAFVQVTVSPPVGGSITISGYRTNY
jgi:MSHA pilin protein MshD